MTLRKAKLKPRNFKPKATKKGRDTVVGKMNRLSLLCIVTLFLWAVLSPLTASEAVFKFWAVCSTCHHSLSTRYEWHNNHYWSEIDGSGAGFGVPQARDSVYLLNRSPDDITVYYSMSSVGVLSEVRINARGTGTMTLLMLRFRDLAYDITNPPKLEAHREYVGYNGGTGTINQRAWTNLVRDRLSVGGSTGLYNLNGGVLSAKDEEIGTHGTGTFNQSGGTNTVTNSLSIGSTGLYNLNGGFLSAKDEQIGHWGDGSTFTQSGGTNTVTNTLTLGGGRMIVVTGGSGPIFGVGQYNLNGGDLSAAWEQIGSYGKSTFTQTGGTQLLYLSSN
jgi:hypothetical protein